MKTGPNWSLWVLTPPSEIAGDSARGFLPSLDEPGLAEALAHLWSCGCYFLPSWMNVTLHVFWEFAPWRSHSCLYNPWKLSIPLIRLPYSKSPTYEPSSCTLSKMQTCIWFQQGTCTCAIMAWVRLQLSLHLLLLKLLPLYHLPPCLPPPVSNSSCLFTWSQFLDASCCTVLLYFSRFCTLRFKMFIFCVCFLCMIYVRIVRNLLQYSTT